MSDGDRSVHGYGMWELTPSIQEYISNSGVGVYNADGVSHPLLLSGGDLTVVMTRIGRNTFWEMPNVYNKTEIGKR